MSSFEGLLDIADRFSCGQEVRQWIKDNCIRVYAHHALPNKETLPAYFQEEDHSRIEEYAKALIVSEVARRLHEDNLLPINIIECSGSRTLQTSVYCIRGESKKVAGGNPMG